MLLASGSSLQPAPQELTLLLLGEPHALLLNHVANATCAAVSVNCLVPVVYGAPNLDGSVVTRCLNDGNFCSYIPAVYETRRLDA